MLLSRGHQGQTIGYLDISICTCIIKDYVYLLPSGSEQYEKCPKKKASVTQTTNCHGITNKV